MLGLGIFYLWALRRTLNRAVLKKATASAQQNADWEGTSPFIHSWGDTGQQGGESHFSRGQG